MAWHLMSKREGRRRVEIMLQLLKDALGKCAMRATTVTNMSDTKRPMRVGIRLWERPQKSTCRCDEHARTIA